MKIESRARPQQLQQVIGELAVQLNRTIDEVQPVYERAFRELASQARIPDYVPLFAARRTRVLLRRGDAG